MPTRLENSERWQSHKWKQQGDEWSPGGCPEGTAVLWHRTLFPRVQRFVPTGTILEIGPGFGRWTQFLRGHCNRLILVDVTDRCIASCRERFAGDHHIEYIVNDGASLGMVSDRSVDFIFSFDSLVHADAEAMGAYLTQAADKLRPGGGGFIHHSNLAKFVNPRTGQVRRFVTRRHWRSESMSADVFRHQCEAAGLVCDSQELINWIGCSRDADRHRLDGRCIPLTDCLSAFRLAEAGSAQTKTIANYGFVEEWRQSVWIADVYVKRGGDVTPRGAARERTPLGRKLTSARTVLRRDGAAAVMALAWKKVTVAVDAVKSALIARLLGEANHWWSRRMFQ